MRTLVVAAALLALAGCSKGHEAITPAAVPPEPAKTQAPAGEYTMDLQHTSLNFRISHLGLSHYTARFTHLDGTLQFDPDRPAASSILVNIDPGSLQTNYPDPKTLDFDAQIQREFLEVNKYPQISFHSTKVEPAGPDSARITGDLTLHGVTKPVTLDATFNGGYPAGSTDPMGARIGFSAHGTIKRSDYGITFGLPAPGSTMGVGDEIEVIVESEFTRPAPTPPAAP